MENQNALTASNESFLRDLQLFCNIARRGSFVAASTEMGLSPSHVSKRVAMLEASLGVKLFQRTTRRVSVTSDGEAALQWAQKILDDVQGMADAFADRRTELRGLLRISTSLRLGRKHVSPILALLRQRHPNLEIWLELLDRRADLVGENFDIDIRVGEVHEPHLIAHKIVESTRILCASPDYLERRGTPLELAELTQHDCLLFRGRDDRFGVWRLSGPNGEKSVKVTGTVASNLSDIVVQWAKDGYGVVMVSIWDVAESLRAGELVRVLPDYMQSADVWAVTAERLSSSAKIQVCIEFLREQLTSGPYALVTRGVGGF
ncbi:MULTISPECIES: LysR family transcriptional regulator [Paraburkholderia]|jgi:LysR family transcriptional activator of dmlA|uniref:LysR family transcriptional regulator n=1 Tax=Paraburkholderia dipogonis TaxID=1211383 RepID=A0ABW9ANC6_9BURK|nr:LysR family transcriptional regulator [Paraburkholderia sp. BL9I2N2]TCK87479.1 LysR family transcriptional regulator [Paraburkholderia sp. BL9I2N2]